MAFSILDSKRPPLSPTRELGATLTKAARKPLPKNPTPEQVGEQMLAEEWGKYLGGPQAAEEEAAILEHFKDPADLMEALKEWRGSDLGFVTENMKIRDMDGVIIPAAEGIDSYQIRMLKAQPDMEITCKGRRLGGSFGSCLASTAAIHRPVNPLSSHFVNRKHDEAKEKIETCYFLWNTIPPKLRVPLGSRGIRAELNFRRKDGYIVKILSHPQIEPRSVEGILWLDEASKYGDQEAIYNAAINAIGIRGQVRLISTPGRNGDLFSDIMENRGGPDGEGYPAFNGHRHRIYWWDCIRLVAPGLFEQAQAEAQHMNTEDRVAKFGSPKLQKMWNAKTSVAMFKVEQECEYFDDASSYYPDELLIPCRVQRQDLKFIKTANIDGRIQKSEIEKKLEAMGIDRQIYNTIEGVVGAVERGEIGNSFVMGVDPGWTDGCVVTLIDDTIPDIAMVRYQEKFTKTEFTAIEAHLASIGQQLPIRTIAIDTLDREGAALASRLRNNTHFGPSRVKEIVGKAEKNSDMAIELQQRLQAVAIGLPDDDDLTRDIKKVRKNLTKDGRPSIQARRDKEGHADRFFSLIYALDCLVPIARSATVSRPMGVSDFERAGIPKRHVPFVPPGMFPVNKEGMIEKPGPPKLVVPRIVKVSDFNSIAIPSLLNHHLHRRPK